MMRAVVRHVEQVVQHVGRAGEQREAEKGEHELDEIGRVQRRQDEARHDEDQHVLRPLVQAHGFQQRLQPAAPVDEAFPLDIPAVILLQLVGAGRGIDAIALTRRAPDGIIGARIADIDEAVAMAFAQESRLARGGEIVAGFRALEEIHFQMVCHLLDENVV